MGAFVQGIKRIGGSWFPGEEGVKPLAPDGSALGLSIFQLAVREIDARASSLPGDLTAALAWIAGRIIQRAAFREEPQRFHADQSANGVVYLQNDRVTRKLGRLEPGSLAAALVEAALLSGARRFPDFLTVRQDAVEAIRRHGAGDLRGLALSDAPSNLSARLQDEFDHLVIDDTDRTMLVEAVIAACAHAVGFNRHRLCPAQAAELSLSIAFHAGWVDQRKTGR